jgi:hypothetical protein
MPPRRPAKKVPRALGRPSLPTPTDSSGTTPHSSAYTSTYASEAEHDCEDVTSKIPVHALTLSDPTETPAVIAPKKKRVPSKPFRFMDLPSELRVAIYTLHFDHTGTTVDLDSDNYKRVHKKLAILRTSRAVYAEASHVFYSVHTFRIFPTQPGRHFKTKKPLLARFNTRQRGLLTSLELRLGPGWNKPPRGWVVNPALGLSECVNVRRLTVFVECDPSDNIFKGFRKSDGFYETFSRHLLDDVLGQLPLLDHVHFDAWSSVKQSGGMMKGLIEVAEARGRQICWGPEWKWDDHDDEMVLAAHAASANALLSSVRMKKLGY